MLKKTVIAALCLALCLLSASCSMQLSTVPTTEPDDSVTLPVSTEAPTTAPQTEPVPETTAPTTAEPQSASSSDLRLADLPTEFYFSSGVGGWGTALNIRPNGTFDGVYSDRDYMEIYYSTFEGAFAPPKRTGEYTYSVRIKELRVTNDPEKVKSDEDGDVRYIPSEPYGLDNDPKELILYVPGTPLSQIPEECLSWLLFLQDDDTVLPENWYLLCNEQEGETFCGHIGNE